jgi:hypothetical protein
MSAPTTRLDIGNGTLTLPTLRGRTYQLSDVASANPNFIIGTGFNSIPVRVGDIIDLPFGQTRTVTAVTDTQLTVDAAWTVSFAGSNVDGRGGIVFEANNAERMRITSGGNVGIGTTNPTDKLSVIGNIYANGGLTCYRTDGGTGLDVNGGDLGTGTFIARFRDYSNNIKVAINGVGQVGIGTNNPSHLLTLVLPSGVNGEIIRMFRSAGAYGWSLGIDSSTSNFNFYNNGNTSVANINNSTGAYTATSDQRLKENILDSNNALEKVLQIKVRKYDWKDTEIKEDFGFIAQELFDVLPQYVHQGDEDTNWGVAKAELVPVLVKAIQEQQSQIESLKAEIQTLKQ